MMMSLIRNTVRTLVGRARNHNQVKDIPCTINALTMTGWTDERPRMVGHVDTPRVRTSSLKRPKQFAFLSVEVPGEEELHALPDLPRLAFEVYPDLPTEEAFGSDTLVSLKRLEHIKLLDQVAYKISVAKGLRTPMPPKLRA